MNFIISSKDQLILMRLFIKVDHKCEDEMNLSIKI